MLHRHFDAQEKNLTTTRTLNATEAEMRSADGITDPGEGRGAENAEKKRGRPRKTGE